MVAIAQRGFLRSGLIAVCLAAFVPCGAGYAAGPSPLLEQGKRLNGLGLCCGDISDGLVREMEKFAEMSGCGCDLRALDVPVAGGASLEDALTSGEEVELVCVGPEDVVRSAGLTTVGVLTRERAVNLEGAEIAGRGYDHFA